MSHVCTGVSSVKAARAKESDCKEVLSFVYRVNESIDQYVVLDPFSMIQKGKLRGRLIRQTLFDGRYQVCLIRANSIEPCGVLFTAKGAALRGRSSSLVFFILERGIQIGEMHWEGSEVPCRVAAITEGDCDSGLERFGFRKSIAVELTNGSMNYYFLEIG